ncbi:hypothetical protein [Helicobacter labetoulli]|uniref:hypothetical protein n=1 Tax=Helicobacter labetoulli TaxID=2315333 RepID=UPI00130080E5|nr:hypothetical protein [Helicobacter labetoulli]
MDNFQTDVAQKLLMMMCLTFAQNLKRLIAIYYDAIENLYLDLFALCDSWDYIAKKSMF